MELELGLKVTRTREDVSSSVDFHFSKDPFGPLVLSRETDSRLPSSSTYAESKRSFFSMAAASLSSSTIPSLNSKEPSSASAFAPRSISAVKFQFPVRRIRTGDLKLSSLSSRTRFTPRAIEAKKQTYNSFNDLLVNSDKPVLVDFYATWCGPCQFMVPILSEVSATLKDKIQVVKIDTEKYPSIANKYKIEALPTFILFKDGEPCDRFEGALTAKQLIQRIEDSLEVKP